tara:strand:- start:176 stop:472 length:297 start_codon:yes stop_codon:yes gene_type:complete
MEKAIRLVDIIETSSEEWKILRFETVATDLASKLKKRSAGIVIKASHSADYSIDEIHEGYTIVTESQDSPYYDGQEPFGKDNLYYQSYVVEVATGNRL